MNINQFLIQKPEWHSFFSFADKNDFAALGVKHFAAKKTPAKKGSPIYACMLIVSGELCVYNEFANGRHYIIENIKSGLILGEMEIASGRNEFVCTVECVTDCMVITIPVGVYTHWLKHSLAFGQQAVKRMAAMLCDISLTNGQNIVYGKELSLALYLAQAYQKQKTATTVTIQDTRQMLAEKTGVSIRSINRAVTHLKGLGLFSLCKGKISITDNQYQALLQYIQKNK